MTVDLVPFEAFLGSLSQISKLKLQVWDDHGLAFSSAGDPENSRPSEDQQKFATQIISRAAFQYAPGDGNDAMFGVPIKNGQRVIGCLVAYSSKADGKSQATKIPFRKAPNPGEMERFLNHLACIMEDKWNAQKETEVMADELSQTFEDLYLYSRLASQIKALQVSSSMLGELLDKFLENMRCDLAFAYLPECQEQDDLVIAQKSSGRIPDCNVFIQSLLRSIPQREPSLQESYFMVADSKRTSEYGELLSDPFRFLAVQIHHKDKLYGWLGFVGFNVEEIFRRSELRLLTSMAEQIGVVIANTHLYRDLERFVIEAVKSLIQAVEAKDRYTRGHSERVSRYCKIMAKRLNLDKEQKISLLWASILHDVGKIGIGENILNKTEPLTDKEWEFIKEHPVKGFGILKPLKKLSESLPGILHHHERWDGRGYPQGLKGEEIPLQARIIAVADTFDAMTSERPYRGAASPQEAVAVMKGVRGTQLDAKLVNLFAEEVNKKLDLVIESSQAQKGYPHESSKH